MLNYHRFYQHRGEWDAGRQRWRRRHKRRWWCWRRRRRRRRRRLRRRRGRLGIRRQRRRQRGRIGWRRRGWGGGRRRGRGGRRRWHGSNGDLRGHACSVTAGIRLGLHGGRGSSGWPEALVRGQCGRLALCRVPRRQGLWNVRGSQAWGWSRASAHREGRRRGHQGRPCQQWPQLVACHRRPLVQDERGLVTQRTNDHIRARRTLLRARPTARQIHGSRLRW